MTPRQKLIRQRIFQAFQNISDIKSDGNIKCGAEEISLTTAEDRVVTKEHLETRESLARRYEQPDDPAVLKIGDITWSRRVDPEALQRDFGISHAETLNQRQLWIVNAVIFEVTNHIVIEHMRDPKTANKNINCEILEDTRAALRKINFSKMGMAMPLDNQPDPDFLEAVSGKLEEDIARLKTLIEEKKRRQGYLQQLVHPTNVAQDQLTIASLETALEKKRELLVDEEKVQRPLFARKK